MTLDEKLKKMDYAYDNYEPGNEIVNNLIAALRRCREQRRKNARFGIDLDPGVLASEKAYTLEIAEKEDDAELLAILQGGGE